MIEGISPYELCFPCQNILLQRRLSHLVFQGNHGFLQAGKLHKYVLALLIVVTTIGRELLDLRCHFISFLLKSFD